MGKKYFHNTIYKVLLMLLYVIIKFHAEMICDALQKNHNKVDLVFLHGNHRIEVIKIDFNAVKNSKVIVLKIIISLENITIL